MSVMISTITGLDFEAVTAELRGASWLLIGLALATAQTPRLSQTASALGAASRPLPARPVYLLQLAQGYVSLAVPTSVGRVAMNVRFFQKQGLSAGAALAKGLLDRVSGVLVEATVLLGLLVVTPQTLHFDLAAPGLPEWRTVLGIVIALAVVLAIVSAALPNRRRQLHEWERSLSAEGHHTLQDLSSPRRLLLLLGGNLASVILFSATLGLFAAALGTTVSASDLVVITISVSLLAGLLPLPGGIGVVEGGLTFGLVAAGMPEDAAFAAVVLYRISTFYLPALWGYFAVRHLEHHGYL
jgi:glycosyltransferase 2 family protein